MSTDINAQAAQEPHIMALKRSVRGLLEPRFGIVVDTMTDQLFNLSASAQLTPEGRTHSFEAFCALRDQRDATVNAMLERVDDNYTKLVEIQLRHGHRDISPAELDLVDLDEFENNLAIDRIVQAGSERYWIQLEALTLRIADIINQDPLTVRLPFGLRGLCVAYRSSIKPLEFSNQILTELDRAFARSLLPEIGTVYQEINSSLSAEGWLPGIENELEVSGSRLKKDTTEAPKRPTPQTQTTEVDPQHAPQQLRQAPQAPMTTANRVGGTPQNAAAMNYGGTGDAPAGNANRGPAGPYLSDMASAESAPLQSAGLAVRGKTSFLESSAPLVAPSPMDDVAGDIGSTDFLPGRGSQALNTTVDAGILERLRTPVLEAGQEYTPLSPAELAEKAQGIADQIAQLRDQGVKATATAEPLSKQLGLDQLGPEAEPLRGSVQMVDNLYQTMLDTLPLSDGMSDSIHILKLPLAQLSLLDPDFFRNREHPARLLVERLSEVTALAPKNSARVEKRIDQVLSDVNADYNGDVEIFDKALAQVTELALTVLRQQQKNIQRQVAAEDGKEKRSRAQHLVEEALIARLPDTALPASILELVDKLLRDDLTLRLLREGDSTAYQAVLTQLGELTQRLLTIAQGQQPLNNDEATAEIDGLRSRLDNAQFLTPEQDALLQQLELELAGGRVVDLLDSTLGDHELFAEPAFSERLKTLPRVSRWVKRARDLDMNAWLAEALPDGSTRNLQLIWRNEANTRFAFANEQGQKVRDLNLVELARWLGRRLRPLAPAEQLSIIEKSVFTTLEQKQQDLASVARPVRDGDLDRSELVDRVQSMFRRARRKGATHCALAIHADGSASVQHVQALLTAAGLQTEAEGQLSPSTRGVIVAANSVEVVQAAIQDQLDNADSAGIGIALIDANQSGADELWRSTEETAKRGLTLSPNKGVVAEPEVRPTDLAGAVRKTYVRLKDDMPPRFSMREITRRNSENPELSEVVFQVLLDGSADTGGELIQQTGYHSAALSIALDCVKINTVCQYSEQLAREGREVPIFSVRLSTDSALHHEFLDFMLNEVSESGIGTDRLCIELRDSSRLREEGRAADFARTLRSIGCHIAICDVHPNRGSTAELQMLSPHMLALDGSLWPPESEGEHLPALHQAISDLHHLVGEHVVLRDERERDRAAALGIDFIETLGSTEIEAQALATQLPLIQR